MSHPYSSRALIGREKQKGKITFSSIVDDEILLTGSDIFNFLRK